MNKRNILYIFVAAGVLLLAAGCGGAKKSVAKPGRYERPPIREVSQEQLESDAALIDALALQESGHSEEALAAYGRLTKKDPLCAAAWYEMAQLLLQRGWTDSARACNDRAVALNGSNVWYQLSLAQVQQRQGDSRGLAATWERIVGQHSEVPEYYYELSNAYIACNDLPKAVEALNRLERRIGVTEPISLQKQKLWNAAGKPDKALREVEALADALPQEKRYQAMLAEIHMKRKDFKKARMYYDRILKADPEDEYIHIQLAEYYKATGHPDLADSEMVRAFDNPRLDARTKVQLLTFYNDEEFFGSHSATAFRLLDKAMSECADSTEHALFYGQVLLHQGRYAQAARQLELALQRDSSQYQPWELLLVSLSEVPEREDDLSRYAARAAALFPMHTLPHYVMAFHHYRHDRHKEALAHLDEAMKWGFTRGYLEAESYSLAAECAYRAGEYEKAWRCFERLLQLMPDDMGTLNNYAYYLAEQGRELEKAERMSRRTVEAEPKNANSLDTYAWILHLLGRNREAMDYIERAVAIDAKSDTLKKHYNTIKESLK